MERGKNEREKENSYEQKAAFKVFYDFFFSSYKLRACGVESVTGRCFQTSEHILLFFMTSRSVGAGDTEEKRVKYRGMRLMVTNQVG